MGLIIFKGDDQISAIIPLAVDGAQGHAPEVGAEAGQLGDVVGHLR